MILSEGLFDELGDYLKSLGILKTKWQGRNLRRGAEDLSQMIGPMFMFKDDEMLNIVKILHKRSGNEIFLNAGFTNTEHDTYEYTFLDLAIVNNNPKTLEWLLNNVKGLYIADAKTFKNRSSITTKNPQWLKDNGLKLIEYVIGNVNIKANKGYSNDTRKALDQLFDTVISKVNKTGWASFNDYIDGILESDNSDLATILMDHPWAKHFITADDMDFVNWLLKHTDWHWRNDELIRRCPKGGKIEDYLNDNPDIVEYVQNNIEKLGVNVEDWLTDTARDIFIF